MKIYKAEKHIANKLINNNSFSFAVKAIKPKSLENALYTQIAKANTSLKLDDLFFHDCILASSNWNFNDDVFMPEELWLASNTPVHKPTNMNHDELDIVGHMFNSKIVDGNFNEIEFDKDEQIYNENVLVDNLPDLFHVRVSSVIYTRYENTDKQLQVDNLIAAINDGKMFVSMECAFLGFDYALMSEGSYDIVTRNKDTAVLSEHLKWYGGSGLFQGKKIGRILRNVHFTGKGYTTNPANEHSIILYKENAFSFVNAKVNEFSIKDGVFHFCNANSNTSNLGKNKMNEEEIKQLQSDLVEANKKVAELTTQAASLASELETIKTNSITELEAKVSELKAVNDKLTALEGKLVASSRVQVLVEGGLDKTDASTHVVKFANLNDEQFKAVSDALIEVKKAKAMVVKQIEVSDLQDDEIDANETVAETAKVEEAYSSTIPNISPDATEANKAKELQDHITQLLSETKNTSRK